jgi:hypothetical protein
MLSENRFLFKPLENQRFFLIIFVYGCIIYIKTEFWPWKRVFFYIYIIWYFKFYRFMCSSSREPHFIESWTLFSLRIVISSKLLGYEVTVFWDGMPYCQVEFCPSFRRTTLLPCSGYYWGIIAISFVCILKYWSEERSDEDKVYSSEASSCKMSVKFESYKYSQETKSATCSVRSQVSRFVPNIRLFCEILFLSCTLEQIYFFHLYPPYLLNIFSKTVQLAAPLTYAAYQLSLMLPAILPLRSPICVNTPALPKKCGEYCWENYMK